MSATEKSVGVPCEDPLVYKARITHILGMSSLGNHLALDTALTGRLIVLTVFEIIMIETVLNVLPGSTEEMPPTGCKGILPSDTISLVCTHTTT